MEAIRVILGNQICLLQDMLKRSIRKIDGVDIVGETREIGELPAMVKAENAHWVIISLPVDEEIPEVFDELLSMGDDLSILAISDSGQKVKIRRLELQEESYQDFSLADLGGVLKREAV